jgi:hypothetical protein
MLLAELLAWAHLGKSFAYAECNQEIKKVPDEYRTQNSMNYIKKLRYNNKMEMSEKDLESRKRRLKALHKTCLGRIQYKKDKVKLAIRLLSRSISESSEALSYLYLARAYKRQLELLKPEAKEQERSIIKRKALICCRRAIDLDFRGNCTKSAERLKKEISGEEEKEPPKGAGEKGTISLEGNAKGTFSWKSLPKEEKQEE